MPRVPERMIRDDLLSGEAGKQKGTNGKVATTGSSSSLGIFRLALTRANICHGLVLVQGWLRVLWSGLRVGPFRVGPLCLGLAQGWFGVAVVLFFWGV